MTETAKMYGGSLYDLAAEEGLETRILGELDEVQKLLKQNPDYLRLLSTPSIPKKERCGLLDEALRGQVHLYVLNFLKILCEKGTLRELSGCARAYRIRYNQAHGILEATAISAVPLTEQLKQRVDFHDLCACPAVEFRCRQELFCLFQNTVCSAVPIMPRQFQQGAVCPQHTVVHAPRINGDAFIGCNGIARLQALFQFFHELRHVPVQSAVLGNGFIGKAVHFLQGDAAAVKTCQHGTAGGRSEIQCQHIPHHGVSSGRTTPFFNRTLA